MRFRSSFFFLQMDKQLFQHYLLKKLSFNTEFLQHLCQKSNGYMCASLYLNSSFCSIDLYVYPFNQYHTVLIMQLYFNLKFEFCDSFHFSLIFQNCFTYLSSSALPCKFENQFIYIYIYSICTGTLLFGKGEKKMPTMGWVAGK